MIPPLDERGLLPPGLHAADLEAIPPRFCFNAQRWRLWDDALAGITILCDQIQPHPRFRPDLILAGSFFSDKPDPEDIEATLVFPGDTPGELSYKWFIWWHSEHEAIKRDTGIDFYPTLPGANDFCSFFQYVGEKTAAMKQLNEKDLRGAVRVDPW